MKRELFAILHCRGHLKLNPPLAMALETTELCKRSASTLVLLLINILLYFFFPISDEIMNSYSKMMRNN